MFKYTVTVRLIDHYWFTCSLVKDADPDLLGLLQLKWKPNNVLSCWPWMSFIVLRQSQHAPQMHLWPPHTPPLSFLSPIVSIYIIFACNCNTQYTQCYSIFHILYFLPYFHFLQIDLIYFSSANLVLIIKIPDASIWPPNFTQCFNLHFFSHVKWWTISFFHFP